MDPPTTVARRQVIVVNARGLHMRPSDKFVRLARSFESEVWVSCFGIRANGKSILDMTTLAAECGTPLDLEASGADADAALIALAELVAAGFHMEDEQAEERTNGQGPTAKDEGLRTNGE
jgi:phosphocarrier protein